MNKKGQLTAALGGAGGVIIILLILFLIIGSQQTNVRKLDVSIGNNNEITALNYTTSTASKFTLWFNSQSSGYFSLKVYTKDQQTLIKEYRNIGGFDFTFYLIDPSLPDCISIRLGAEPSDRQLGFFRPVCLNDGGQKW